MSKHTPGPWHVLVRPQANTYEVFGGKLSSSIDARAANARLIAAAPDMLEALQAIAEAEGQPDEVLQMAMIRARAVLAEINQE